MPTDDAPFVKIFVVVFIIIRIIIVDGNPLEDITDRVVAGPLPEFRYGQRALVADFNKDGNRDISDIFIYLNAWFAHSAFATVNGDGAAQPGIADIFLFLNAWFAGCS